MKEAFEKIIERLEEQQEEYIKDYDRYGDGEDYRISLIYERAIKIDNQVAEEYGKDTNVRRNDELLIHVMHGYDSLEAPNGEMCFGCYVKGKYEIYVADDIPKEQFFQTIAHEYIHYLQDIEGKDFSEEEADAFATDINVGSNDGWIPCSSGEMPEEDKVVWITSKRDDGSIFVAKDWVCDGELYRTRRESAIAWKYIDIPEPYKPKGEK